MCQRVVSLFTRFAPARSWLRSIVCAALGCAGVIGAEESQVPDQAAIRAAVAKSLPLLEHATRVSKRERGRCFTCHNQGLPIIAFTTAASRGFTVDQDNLRDQVSSIAKFLAKNEANYREGRGQGGQADTAGYALWTLARAQWPGDETTSSVTEYLLRYQSDRDHWTPPSHRPPTEESPFTSTHVAVRGLKAFGTPDQQERIRQRVDKARQWLIATPTKSTEDNVSRLRALAVTGAEPREIGNAAQALLHTQRADGGWAQLPEMESDPYATATALSALHEAADLPVSDRTYANGISYLLRAQLPDGSWHVKTRSKPIQEYYESGYPHGRDQFISISAACWATIALVLALDVPEAD